jgi:hypothetical protein
MNNKNIQLKTNNKSLGGFENALNNKDNVLGTSLNNTGYVSPTSIWNNSIYSFNQNFMKNLPSVDNIVNKMIKSFFTINPLDNNVNGKKSKLIQRRYKRLSLNKILVSKSEIKHSNNKVSITVYLFNKKKRSLLLSLNELYNSLSLGLVSKGRSWKKRNNFETLATKEVSLVGETNITSSKGGTFRDLAIKKHNLITTGLALSGGLVSNNHENLGVQPLNFASEKVISNKYAFMSTSSALSSKGKKNTAVTSKENSIDTGIDSQFKSKILYYNRLNNLTKYNIYKFLTSLKGQEAFISTTGRETSLLKEFFVYTTKYKLYYNNVLTMLDTSVLKEGTSVNNIHIGGLAFKNPNYTFSKLKSIYKLFALYNNIKGTSLTLPLVNSDLKTSFSKKILLNTHKLIKKSYNDSRKGLGGLNLIRTPITLQMPNANFKANSYKGLFTSRKPNNAIALKALSEKKTLDSVILVNKLNRIDRFFNKYSEVLKTTLLSNSVTNMEAPAKASGPSNAGSQIIKSLASNYKINFINDVLEKELLYIYYLKLLSYNNALFKNWFLFSLKNLLAKIYNKKVVLNLVNLKYIHLNSDILSEAVNIRLRNFRKNKIVDVLKKAVKLVSISKVNIYACDEHSSMYKYIHNYYDKFKHLKLDIFKELGCLETNPTKANIREEQDNSNYVPCTIKRLNHIQTSTINFIKFKSVFGVRLEAAGRLTKRSTASRAVFKFRYKGTLKNNPTINNSLSSAMVKNHQISNLQFTKISSKTRNGSFGLKGWINSN